MSDRLHGCREGGVSDRLHGCREGGVSDRLHGCREGGVADRLHGCREGGVSDHLHVCREGRVSDHLHGCRDDGVADRWLTVFMAQPEAVDVAVPAHLEPREAYLTHIFTPGRFTAAAITRALNVSGPPHSEHAPLTP